MVETSVPGGKLGWLTTVPIMLLPTCGGACGLSFTNCLGLPVYSEMGRVCVINDSNKVVDLQGIAIDKD